MKKQYMLYAALAAFVVLGGMLALKSSTDSQQRIAVHEDSLRTIQLRGQNIRVTVADTDASREKGLSGRSGLSADEGMLFAFPEDRKYAFWMKDMLFSIDIVWISEGGAVVFVAQNVSPDTYPRAFAPESPARYVLELPAGYIEAHSIVVGDVVRL